jgi:hypothetical protein
MQTVNGIQIIQDVPDIIYNAIIKQMKQYDKGEADISVTELLKPAREVILKKEYYEKIEKLASSFVDALEGSALHHIIELGATDDYFIEQRVFKEFEGWMISGKFDAYYKPDKELIDWKRVKVWEYVFGVKQEKIDQLNILRYILKDFYPVEKLTLGFIYSDWVFKKAKRTTDGSYPTKKIAFQHFDPMLEDDVETLLRSRLGVLRQYTQDNILPECTKEERWYRGEQWACMKKGRKSAMKVFKLDEDPDSMHKAMKYCQVNGLTVERRPGSYERCQYCSVESVCEQAREK